MWVVSGAFVLSWLLILLLKTLRPPPSPPEGFHVIVVGAGPGGIAMGKRLHDIGVRQRFLLKYIFGNFHLKSLHYLIWDDHFEHFGFNNQRPHRLLVLSNDFDEKYQPCNSSPFFNRFTILEKESMLGGTWLKNRYPGCECDVFAHFYSFSFSLVSFVFLKGVLIVILQNLSWSKAYPGQKEILNYLNTVAAKFGVLSSIRFNTKVVRSVWSHQTKVWTVETASGQTFKGD